MISIQNLICLTGQWLKSVFKTYVCVNCDLADSIKTRQEVESSCVSWKPVLPGGRIFCQFSIFGQNLTLVGRMSSWAEFWAEFNNCQNFGQNLKFTAKNTIFWRIFSEIFNIITKSLPPSAAYSIIFNLFQNQSYIWCTFFFLEKPIIKAIRGLGYGALILLSMAESFLNQI